jgi:pSer/pThr/pTyr-binding forkhead associated (FHA) protein
MDVKLIVVDGKNAGQKIPVPAPKFFIGRAEDCHLRPTSSSISRHHAVILVEDGYVAVRDFASKNGTFVNDEPVHVEHELKNGDRLRVGPLAFDVELAVEVGGKKKPKVHSIEEAAARTAQSGSSGDELDIFGLLGEDDDTTTGEPAVAETQTVDMSPTAVDSGEDTPKKDEKLPPGVSKKKRGGGLSAGRYDQNEQPLAESSRAAADEVLKQFMGRKR